MASPFLPVLFSVDCTRACRSWGLLKGVCCTIYVFSEFSSVVSALASHGDSWVAFRRYTNFCRLNDKIKELFPSCRLALPPKRWFKDNYGEELLEERHLGLQTFLQNPTLHKLVISSEAVRHFLYSVDLLSPFERLEESKAFCETLKEANHRLPGELLENQREVATLEKTLKEKKNHISLLVKKVKSLSLCSESFEMPRQLTATIATDTHGEGDSNVNGFKQKHTDGNEDDGVDRGYSNQDCEPSSPSIFLTSLSHTQVYWQRM